MIDNTPLAAGTAVRINFGGAIGTKEGEVVADDGGEKLTVSYVKKAGKGLEVAEREVARTKVELADAPAAAAEPTAEPTEVAAAEQAPAEQADEPADEPTPAPVKRPSNSALLALAQSLVITYGPKRMLDHGLNFPGAPGVWRSPDGDEVLLNADELARLDNHARYQAGRVLIFFGGKEAAPEGHDARRHYTPSTT